MHPISFLSHRYRGPSAIATARMGFLSPLRPCYRNEAYAPSAAAVAQAGVQPMRSPVPFGCQPCEWWRSTASCKTACHGWLLSGLGGSRGVFATPYCFFSQMQNFPGAEPHPPAADDEYRLYRNDAKKQEARKEVMTKSNKLSRQQRPR
jgi:hypothetical protein